MRFALKNIQEILSNYLKARCVNSFATRSTVILQAKRNIGAKEYLKYKKRLDD